MVLIIEVLRLDISMAFCVGHEEGPMASKSKCTHRCEACSCV